MKIRKSKNQKGNVLFLILIAVALFAALSYAVTQSSRSGGDASKETNVINTASLTQYPNAVRTAVLRMIIGGLDPTVLQFNKPDQFGTSGFTAFQAARGVFSVTGGGASYQQVPANLTSGGSALDWKFNMNIMIPQLGTDATGGGGNDLIAYADGVTQTICQRVNQDLGWGASIPNTNATITLANDRTATTAIPTVPSATGTIPNDGSTPNWFQNKAFGCFQNNGGNYVFYYTLAER